MHASNLGDVGYSWDVVSQVWNRMMFHSNFQIYNKTQAVLPDMDLIINDLPLTASHNILWHADK